MDFIVFFFVRRAGYGGEGGRRCGWLRFDDSDTVSGSFSQEIRSASRHKTRHFAWRGWVWTILDRPESKHVHNVRQQLVHVL